MKLPTQRRIMNMRKDAPMKYRFELMDKATGKNFTVDSVTNLGEPGHETHITTRKDGVDTGHDVTVISRKLLKELANER